jgi:pimeloyl-ACP methyl ester carboxylesterase
MDNYGRGESDLPFTYTNTIPELFAGQLAELLFVLCEFGAIYFYPKICSCNKGPIDLVGYSMGGCIVGCFANRFGPTKVASLILIASAGLPSMSSSISDKTQAVFGVISQLPFGHSLALKIAKTVLSWGLSEEGAGWCTADVEIRAAYIDYCNRRLKNEQNLPHAFVDTVTTFPFAGCSSHFQGVAEQGILTLALWGGQDDTVPVKCSHELRLCFDQSGQSTTGTSNQPLESRRLINKVWPHCGHMLPLEEATEVAREMLSFWVQYDKKVQKKMN